MSRLWKFLVLAVLIAALILPTTLLAFGCGEDTTTTAAGTTATADTTAIAERANEVLNTDAGEFTGYAVAGETLAGMLADPTKKDTLYLLDVRQPDDYAKDHIAGAVNVPFAEWATPESLNSYPKDKTIVVICYTGHTAAEAVGGLRMLGYNAVALRAGMMGWTQGEDNQQVAATLEAANNPVVNTPAEPSGEKQTPGPLTQPSTSLYETMAGLANTDMSSMPTSGDYANNVIDAAQLKQKLADNAEKKNLFLLDIRGPADYEKVGHIEGAVNIPFGRLAMPANLEKLPKDKKIIVICYTGNTAGQATMILRLMGYDAANLKYGSMGWAKNDATAGFVNDITTSNNPVVQ